jgi:hypothetical protein
MLEFPRSGLHPVLDDTRLSQSRLALELHRAQISDPRVPAFRIVEALDVIEHVGLGLIPRALQLARSVLTHAATSPAVALITRHRAEARPPSSVKGKGSAFRP